MMSGFGGWCGWCVVGAVGIGCAGDSLAFQGPREPGEVEQVAEDLATLDLALERLSALMEDEEEPDIEVVFAQDGSGYVIVLVPQVVRGVTVQTILSTTPQLVRGEVIAEANTGSLRLETFGREAFELVSEGAEYRFLVSSDLGEREFSFPSGTRFEDMVVEMIPVTAEIGVRTRFRPVLGIPPIFFPELTREEVGPETFLTVTYLDLAGESVYFRPRPRDGAFTNSATFPTFEGYVVGDGGVDLRLELNGVEAPAAGRRVTYVDEDESPFNGSFDVFAGGGTDDLYFLAVPEGSLPAGFPESGESVRAAYFAAVERLAAEQGLARGAASGAGTPVGGVAEFGDSAW